MRWDGSRRRSSAGSKADRQLRSIRQAIVTTSPAEAGFRLEAAKTNGGKFGRGLYPRSHEAEISVLGAMLLESGARKEALNRLDAKDFSCEANRLIFRAFSRLNEVCEADVVMLSDELKSAGEIDKVGGMAYLAQLVDVVPTAANLEFHADRLRELRALRELRGVAESVRREAVEAGPGQGDEVVAEALERLREVQAWTAVAADKGLRTAREILEDPDARRTPETVVDRLVWAGRTTLLAGREKSGKSTLIRWAAMRRSRGLRVWGRAPLGGPLTVLYWGQEVDVDVAADLERLGANLDQIHYRDMRRHAGDRFALLSRDLDQVEPEMVVIDTLSTFTDRMDLDPGSSADWEPVMNRLNTLAQGSDAGFVLNHHARKADGQYRDSTAIGAGVDCILEMRHAPSEGDRVRKVAARARSAVPARDFEYVLAGTEEEPRLEILDGSLSLKERVQRFVADHEACSQRDVIDGVRGKTEAVRDALQELSEDGGPVNCDDSSSPYRYSSADNPRGNATETVGKRSGNGSTDSGGRSVSPGAPPSARGGRQETQAGSVVENATPRRYSCGRRIGPTSDQCVDPKR